MAKINQIKTCKGTDKDILQKVFDDININHDALYKSVAEHEYCQHDEIGTCYAHIRHIGIRDTVENVKRILTKNFKVEFEKE